MKSNSTSKFRTMITADIQRGLELCRVAREVRIFPLHTLANDLSPHLAPVMEALEQQGYRVKRVKVPYEFQKGATEMLQVVAI